MRAGGLCLKLLCVALTGNGACYTHDSQERWRHRAVSIDCCTVSLTVKDADELLSDLESYTLHNLTLLFVEKLLKSMRTI